MPSKKRIILVMAFITIIVLIFTAYKIVTTYAVFYSEVSGTTNKDLAKWKVNVNGETIQNFTIGSLNVEQSNNVKAGKLAPGTKGNFIIDIDPNNTQVSVRYDISINLSNITNDMIYLDSVSEIGSGNAIIQTEENTYTGIIPLSNIDGTYTEEVKLAFVWENDENNNEEDSVIGKVANLKIEIPITIKIRQYLGEEINPYI